MLSICLLFRFKLGSFPSLNTYKMERQWLPCGCNSSSGLIPIILKPIILKPIIFETFQMILTGYGNLRVFFFFFFFCFFFLLDF